MVETATVARPVHRGERRRLETRARLLAAAERVFGRRGVEAGTIAEITTEADVGLGTFYHHFDSKEALVDALSTALTESEGAALDAATRGMSDAAEVMAASIRHVVRRAAHDPVWASFVVRAGPTLPRVAAGLVRRSRRDLERGVAARRFRVSDADTAHAALCGAVIGVMQGRLAGSLPEDADRHVAAQMLQLLGLPPDEAARIARRPLPTVGDGAPRARRRR